MFKVGDKITFKRYKDIPNWKLDIHEITCMDSQLGQNRYGVKCKCFNSNGEEIYMHSKDMHNEDELMLPIKIQRKRKLDAIQERR